MKLYEATITVETDDDRWTDQQLQDYLDQIEDAAEDPLDELVALLRAVNMPNGRRTSVNWNL